MDQNPLLHMLAELDGKIRALQQERNEAVARAKALEREVGEMSKLVGMVRTRVEKMLKPGEEEVPPESNDLERLDEFSPDPDRKPDLGASSI